MSSLALTHSQTANVQSRSHPQSDRQRPVSLSPTVRPPPWGEGGGLSSRGSPRTGLSVCLQARAKGRRHVTIVRVGRALVWDCQRVRSVLTPNSRFSTPDGKQLSLARWEDNGSQSSIHHSIQLATRAFSLFFQPPFMHIYLVGYTGQGSAGLAALKALEWYQAQP